MDISWMPATGRHQVEIGSSLGRALKARKGTSIGAAKRIPDRNFHSCRYNFKPESIDPSKTGSIEVKKGKDNTSVTVERASTQAGENHIFVGAELPAKEWECVLIYDEELGRFTLEKLDSYVQLNYDRKSSTMTASARPISPLPPPADEKPSMDLDAEIDKDFEDAIGEPDDDFAELLSASISKAVKEEEEEGEEGEISSTPPAPARPLPTPTSQPLPPQRPTKPPAPRPTKAKGPQSGAGTGKGKAKRDPVPKPPVSHAEEEDLEFGRPARQFKRLKPSPSPPPSQLAFPTGPSTSLVLPSSLPAPLAPAPDPVPTPIKLALEDSDEEEWDEIAASAPPPPQTQPEEEDEDEEEIDENLFNAEMDLELGPATPPEDIDIDFLAAAVSPEPEVPTAGGGVRPMSLNQYASGATGVDEDDYTSTDESDEE
ncbi:hypothetical protein JAAARDRAFT_28677 [Jaapia argillacea MUCL 33604]|uniref:Transcription elongation factor Eaf N-terminal domain-containing protein n=1 Tax=Jaapia argillacea MUCL 33604 TaxID=933084 RepID=A0A067QDK2_9AGAM|nr:hypothetical protein JAAARDRAFT_28677 [Jaapia argillacea MUCL 33604]